MTYPPGNPSGQTGYQPGTYGNPSFAKTTDAESKLPLYLQITVAVSGLAVYLASFGPVLTAVESEFTGLRGHAGLAVPLAVLAGLLAAVGTLPKAKRYTAVVAVLACLGALLAIARTATKDEIYSIGWGLWLVLGFSIVQAGSAVAALLLEAGVIAAPAPRPKYDPYAQYGLPPGGGYYPQPGQPGQPGQPARPGGQPGFPPAPQQSGYPSYGGYPQGPSTGAIGGFGGGAQQSPPQGPPTPPTGFPSFGPPPSSGAGTGPGSGSTGADQPGGSAASPAPSGPTQS